MRGVRPLPGPVAVFLWFVGLSLVGVALVFSSPALDHRMVMVGSVIPLVEVVFGEPRALHSLTAPVLVLAVVMLATQRRRLVRRRWLGIPIGMFLHLVLDGTWTDTEAFWWPAFGLEFSDARLGVLSRGGLNIVLEVAGLAALVWARDAFGLRDPAAWREFRRTGRLPRGPVAG